MTTIARQMTIRAVLAFLDEAGPDGAITTVIAQSFDLPVTHQKRSNRVSQIMRELGGRGWAAKAGTEPTPLYRNTPVSRWRITEDGHRACVVMAAAETERTTRPVRMAALRGEMLAIESRRREAMAGAYEAVAKRYQTRLGITRCFRRKMILDLRKVPCSLAEIGELFGIQRERTRQIEMGLERPCACRECILTLPPEQSLVGGFPRPPAILDQVLPGHGGGGLAHILPQVIIGG